MSNPGAYRQYANAATRGHTKISIFSLTPLIVGSRGPERPASEELLSRVAPPSGGPFQQAECHAGATAPGPQVQKSVFSRFIH